jgi:hypothetical protein
MKKRIKHNWKVGEVVVMNEKGAAHFQKIARVTTKGVILDNGTKWNSRGYPLTIPKTKNGEKIDLEDFCEFNNICKVEDPLGCFGLNLAKKTYCIEKIKEFTQFSLYHSDLELLEHIVTLIEPLQYKF